MMANNGLYERKNHISSYNDEIIFQITLKCDMLVKK